MVLSYKKHEVLILHNEVSGGSTQLEGIGKKAQNREKQDSKFVHSDITM